MDIEVVVKRTVVFAGLVGAVVAVVSLMTFVSQDVLAHFVQVPKWLSNVLAAAIIAGVYGPLRNWLVNTTERYLFQKKYDYKELLKKFTDEVGVVVDLRQLVTMTVATLADTIKLQHCVLLLLNRDKRVYELAAVRGGDAHALALEEQEPFITFLRETHEPIGQDGPLGNVRFPEAVTQRLLQLRARLCLPLHIHDDLIGVLCLGKKKSDEEFTKDDLDILLPLARTLAIAIGRAELAIQRERLLIEVRKGDQQKAVALLASGLAHEIKNPLAAIKTFVEFLPEKAHDPAFLAKFHRIVGGEVEKIRTIVQNLLTFAKPEISRHESVDLEQVTQQTLALLSGDCLKRQVRIETALESPLPGRGDPTRLRQVLLNLCLNSLEAMEGGGTLRVEGAQRDGHIELTIQDTGCGIPPNDLRSIFEPFFTTKPTGTGLGLCVVQGIIKEHGGDIHIESVQGQGTTVRIQLPAIASLPTPDLRSP